MRRAGDLDDYVRDYRDAYVIGREYCAFHAAPDLFGFVVWGRPDVSQAREVTFARQVELADETPHRVVLDYRLVEVVDRETFAHIGDWVTEHHDALAARTSKAAVIQPTDPFAAAVVGGFYSVVKSPYPSQVCATAEEADAWLGAPTGVVLAEIRELCRAGKQYSVMLQRLLDQSPMLSIDEAAHQLGLTSRTLQRRLRDDGTTFRVEARKAVVRRAKALLTSSDGKIADIAASLGVANAQHFTELFRAETGETPAAWRAKVRGDRGE